MTTRFDKLIDLDRLALAVDKIKTALNLKANSADLGTAAAADKETTVANDGGLPTGAAVMTYVTGLGYQTSSDVSSAISGKANTSDLGTAAGVDTESAVANDGDVPTGAAVMTYVAGLGYQTQSQVQTLINSAVQGITGISFEIVNSLPQSGTTGVIYLLSNSGSAPNVYDEYIWLSGSSSFEKIGTTDVDLSGYVQASEITLATNSDVNALFTSSSNSESGNSGESGSGGGE